MQHADLPDDVINVIVVLLDDFYRADACERVRAFRTAYSVEWGKIVCSVNESTPIYTLEFSFGRITVLSPDCCPSSFIPFMPARKIYRHVR